MHLILQTMGKLFGKFIEIKILQSVDAGAGKRGGLGGWSSPQSIKGGLAPRQIDTIFFKKIEIL